MYSAVQQYNAYGILNFLLKFWEEASVNLEVYAFQKQTFSFNYREFRAVFMVH